MSKKTKIIIGVVIVIFVLSIMGAAGDNKKTEPAPTQTARQEAAQEQKVPEEKPEYQIAFRDENNRVENYELLITPGADGKAAALDVKKQCKKPCNIYVYDDSKAQKLEREYADISDADSTTAWKKKNYVYVADHLVGSIDFETGEWQGYPYRDFYYRENGGKN